MGEAAQRRHGALHALLSAAVHHGTAPGLQCAATSSACRPRGGPRSCLSCARAAAGRCRTCCTSACICSSERLGESCASEPSSYDRNGARASTACLLEEVCAHRRGGAPLAPPAALRRPSALAPCPLSCLQLECLPLPGPARPPSLRAARHHRCGRCQRWQRHGRQAAATSRRRKLARAQGRAARLPSCLGSDPWMIPGSLMIRPHCHCHRWHHWHRCRGERWARAAPAPAAARQLGGTRPGWPCL